jgi:hypothetical protein
MRNLNQSENIPRGSVKQEVAGKKSLKYIEDVITSAISESPCLIRLQRFSLPNSKGIRYTCFLDTAYVPAVKPNVASWWYRVRQLTVYVVGENR